MFDIETTIARAEIQDLMVRYCRGIDRADTELVKSVYHPDATDNHGVFDGDAAEFADFAVPLLAAAYSCTQHQLSNMIIDVDGDAARAETYFTAHHAYTSEDGKPRLTLFGGRYVDRLERREGRWGIVARVVIHDWSDDRETTPYEHVQEFPQGGHAAQDRSTEVFPVGWGHSTLAEGSAK